MPSPIDQPPADDPVAPPLDPVAIRACLTELVAHEFDREWENVLEQAQRSKTLDEVNALLVKWRHFAHAELTEPGSYFRVLAKATRRLAAAGRSHRDRIITARPIVRRSARAILIDNDGRLITVKRTRPGQSPYWTTAGGGVEPDDASREAAAERELGEELGAIVQIGPQVFLITTPWGEGVQVQHFFLARLLGFDPALRTGPEHTAPERGSYELDRTPLNHLSALDLRPIQLRDFIIANATALLADLPAGQ